MDKYRGRERLTIPDESWKPGQDAQIFDLAAPRGRDRVERDTQEQSVPAPRWDIEPYDPSQHHEPAELYSQNSLDALEKSGFQPHEPGVWHRPVTTDEGEHLGANHIIVHDPGHRRTTDGTRAPWHLMTDPESIGEAYSSLGGPGGAIAAADADREQLRKMPEHTRLFLAMVRQSAQTPGRANADDWLTANPEESFEHDPRQEARDWMDQNAHQYDEWHPDPSDYTHEDFGDMAGQSFHGEGESESHVLPGSHYHPDLGQRSEYDQDDDEPDDEPDDENLTANHGFDWEPQDSTAGSPGNPLTPETPGKYVKHQIDTEGNHVATHTITPGGHQTGQWTLHTEIGNHGLPVTFPESVHGSLDWALHKYKQNSAEAMLPRYGYDYERGPGGGVTYWTKSTPHPAGEGHEDIQHEISFPDHGFLGQTENVSNGSLFAPNGSQAHHSEDLADVVREQHRLERGIHPGGIQDFRMHPTDLVADPSVASLGRPETTSTPWGDNRVNRMTWRIPHAEAPHGVNAEANYNWDTGNYDFGYTHDGTPLPHTHNYVPAGAPVRVPGRQPQLPLESAR
jgi:hypothetical protein